MTAQQKKLALDALRVLGINNCAAYLVMACGIVPKKVNDIILTLIDEL